MQAPLDVPAHLQEKFEKYCKALTNEETLHRFILHTIQLEEQANDLAKENQTGQKKVNALAQDFQNLLAVSQKHDKIANQNVDFLLTESLMWSQKGDHIRELRTVANDDQFKNDLQKLMYV